MSARPINPALGMKLVPERTLQSAAGQTVSVVIPAHNETATVAEVIADARRSLDLLGVDGEVIVAASACTDDTAQVAAAAGADVVQAPIGKGAALTAGIAQSRGDIVCIVDADVQYFGETPLVALLAAPILHGIADVTISDLYWRPLYPQLWLAGFWAPLAGRLFPDLLPLVGSTPWSGQRAARRALWPDDLPAGFTVDLALLLHWREHALRMRPVLADDWVNPQRPKADLMRQEFDLLVGAAVRAGRATADDIPNLIAWFTTTRDRMADLDPDVDDPQEFERQLLDDGVARLRAL